MNCNFDVDDAVEKLAKLGLAVRVISPFNFLVFNLGSVFVSGVILLLLCPSLVVHIFFPHASFS